MPTFSPPQTITQSPRFHPLLVSHLHPRPLTWPPGEKHDAAPAPGSEAGHTPQTSLPWTLPGRHCSPGGLCRPGGYHPRPQGEGCGASTVCGGAGILREDWSQPGGVPICPVLPGCKTTNPIHCVGPFTQHLFLKAPTVCTALGWELETDGGDQSRPSSLLSWSC